MKGIVPKRILAAGHICLDITPVFPNRPETARLSELLEPGKLIQVEAASVHTGGSVANTGLALKLLGNDVRLLGKTGSDAFGGMLQSILAEYGAGGLIVDSRSSTSYSVVLAVPGVDRIFLHHPGANDTFSASDIRDEALSGAALFHFGYPPLMRKMYENDGKELAKLFRRVSGLGIATSLDLAAVDPRSDAGKADWQKILSEVLPFVDFFTPSFEELCFMLNRPLYDALAQKGGDMTRHSGVLQAADELAKTSLSLGCASALVKCGLSGMVYRTGSRDRVKQVGKMLTLDPDIWSEKAGTQPCFQVETVCSGTGAGDVSIAAYLTAVLNGESPEVCVRLAAAEGAASVTSYDALGGILPMEELKHRIANGWKTTEDQ